MKLLIKSVLRHIKQHKGQTFFTFLITVLVVAMLSAVFQVVSGFQMLLREYALESAGEYHYCYSTTDEDATAKFFRQMAEEFQEDAFFSAVDLEEKKGEVNLRLTVAKPGLFTTRQMEKRLEQAKTTFRAEYKGEFLGALQIGYHHNFELLVSYEDLHKSNGMYSFLLVFLLVFGVIVSAAMVTLGAVFRVSAVQRERDFGLFMSIGASGKQIKQMLIMESMIYIMLALPIGYFLGIVFFECSKNEIDNLLHGLLDFPPIRLVISVPWSVMMILSAIFIILGSVWKAAVRSAKLHPMEALRQNKSITVLVKESSKQTNISEKKLFGITGWLAGKNARRFRRRYRPVFLVMTVAIIVSFVMTGFRQFTTDIADMTYRGMEYNIAIQLNSDNTEALHEMSEQLTSGSDGTFHKIRKASFRLGQEFPLSELGRETGVMSSTFRMPDVVFFSVDENNYNTICDSIGIEPDTSGKMEGILINADQVWESKGVICQGVPFQVLEGETISIVSGAGARQEVTVAGLWDEFPDCMEADSPVTLVMLVSECLIDKLQPLSFMSLEQNGVYGAELRGLVEKPEEAERMANGLLESSLSVTGEVYNFEREMREDIASIAGFRYLMTALVVVLVLVCLCGNFVVTWTMGTARQKEFAILHSLGMTPGELRGMRWLEQLLYSCGALLTGAIPGALCYRYIFNVYSQMYRLEWKMPYEAFGISIGILAVSGVLAELVMGEVLKKKSTAELLKVDEM